MRNFNAIDQSQDPGVSIIVCCFNSSSRIAETLKHLGMQILPADIKMEVIIVNNASDDDLLAAVKDSWVPTREDYSLRIVEQPTLGLANARMKGVMEAKFDYAIFCDDDNWLCPSYVATAYSLLSSKPMLGIVGGASTPSVEGEIPSWFFTNAFAYAVGIQNEESGVLTERHYVWGAGMGIYVPFLRKAYSVGIRPILSDRTGTELYGGNDTELCLWFLMAGYQLWYDERLEFQHFIPTSRIQKEYLNRVKGGFRHTDPVLRSYKSYLILQRRFGRCKDSSTKEIAKWMFRYLKAFCAWHLTNGATRTKIKKIKRTVATFSNDRSCRKSLINQ